MPDLLFVCEGNTCRSPYAEYHLRHALDLDEGGGLVIGSAGVRAATGSPIDPTIAQILADEGAGGTEAHRASQLTRDDLSESALVLTATRRLRHHVVKLHAPAVRSTFTIRQLGAMLAAALEHDPSVTELRAGDPRQMLADLISGVRSARGVVPTREVDLDDVVDPVGGPVEAYRQAVREMEPALRDLASVLRAATTTPEVREVGSLTRSLRS